MALSRLRHPLFSRSLRILSFSTRSLSRISNSTIFAVGAHTNIRPKSFSGITRICDRSLKSKWTDVKCFSSSGTQCCIFQLSQSTYLAKILALEGSKDVAVGHPIAITVEDASATKQRKAPQHDTKSGVKAKKNKITRISPAAKLLIAEYGLDASTLNAAGHYGTLLKGNVLSEIRSGKLSPKPATSREKVLSSQSHQQVAASQESNSDLEQSDAYEDFPDSQIRKVIAKRLLESKQNTLHLYLSSDVILDPLLSLRMDLKEQ